MVGFFPTPYPDECLYSILCRYYAHSGSEGYETVCKVLFGNLQALMGSIFQPIRVECVDSWASSTSGITRRSIAENHTLYPYWAISYSPDFRAETEYVLNGGTPAQEYDRISSFKSRRSWSKHLKYCPLCVADDFMLYGETYWRRQHQLSEMVYCVKHQTRLIDSDITVRRATTGFYPASIDANIRHDSSSPDCLAPYKEKFIRIGQECEWLISQGVAIDWAINGYGKYTRLLRDKGLASFQGRCDYKALKVAFYDYWGKDFIDCLIDVTADTRFNGWVRQVESNKMRSYKPLYHILLMCLVADSVSNFVNCDPADTPYGHPPFICENPICPQYHISGAKMVSIKYYSTGATAFFECSHCGMNYKHNKSKQSRELRVVIDYGHLWHDKLLHCSRDPKITNEQTMEILKCTMSVLMLQKKKRGLMEPYLYDMEMGPEKYYKMRVEELCAEYDEVTISLLQEKVPGAYSYLGDHHKDWLRSRIVFERERSHYRDSEAELLDKVKSAVAKIYANGIPYKRISLGYVAKMAGCRRDELRRERNSSVITFLDGVVESDDDWLRRRVAVACKKRKDGGKPITVIGVWHDLGRKTSNRKKYENMLKEWIDDFNNQL